MRLNLLKKAGRKATFFNAKPQSLEGLITARNGGNGKGSNDVTAQVFQ